MSSDWGVQLIEAGVEAISRLHVGIDLAPMDSLAGTGTGGMYWNAWALTCLSVALTQLLARFIHAARKLPAQHVNLPPCTTVV